MEGRASDYLVGKWLDVISSKTCFAGLNTNSADQSQMLANEMTGSSYARAQIQWTKYSRYYLNANTLVWSGLPSFSVIQAVSVWDAAWNGHLLFSCPVVPAVSIPIDSSTWKILPGELVIGIDITVI